MKIHYFFPPLLLSALSLQASASQGDNLVVTPSQGEPATISLTSVEKITFDDGKLIILSGEATSVFDLDEIESLTFDLALSSAEEISEVIDDITFSSSGDAVTINRAAEGGLSVDVYTIAGIKVASLHDASTVTVDFAGMDKGIYIIRANNKTIKYSR